MKRKEERDCQLEVSSTILGYLQCQCAKSKKEKHHKHDKEKEDKPEAKKVGSEVRSSLDEASNISSASTEQPVRMQLADDNLNDRALALEKAQKPLLEMNPHEIRQLFKLKRVDCFVKTKNRRKVHNDFQSCFPTDSRNRFSDWQFD